MEEELSFYFYLQAFTDHKLCGIHLKLYNVSFLTIPCTFKKEFQENQLKKDSSF